MNFYGVEGSSCIEVTTVFVCMFVGVCGHVCVCEHVDTLGILYGVEKGVSTLLYCSSC